MGMYVIPGMCISDHPPTYLNVINCIGYIVLHTFPLLLCFIIFSIVNMRICSSSMGIDIKK